ncbi:MAG: 2-oxoacid:acceptor oxidoreductase family protein [Planctomycetota bacterium]|nr:2-oxoacid:acceptor oxidoreductase family protein [Planctomycetota bacterium]
MRLPYRCNGGLTIVLAGLGGQGILLMAKAIASAARKRFEFVCRSEFRGLSQRGGAVQSCVRFASNPVTSVVDVEEADLILALDALEAARALPYLKQGGLVVAHVGVVPPLHISRTWQEAGCPKREAQLFSTYVLERFEGIENVQMLDLDTLAKKSRVYSRAKLCPTGCGEFIA